jgi:formyltetrahydrofolate synthetase
VCRVLQVSRFVRLDIDPKNVMWRRVVDINDRWEDRRACTSAGSGVPSRGC